MPEQANESQERTPAVRIQRMTHFVRRLLPVLLLVAATLHLFAPAPCYGMRSIRIVTKEMAREMGLEVRATASGPNAAWIELKLKAEGKLKDFSHVELEIRDGEKMLIAYAAMGEKRTDTGNIVARLMVDRAYLEKVTLVVVTGLPMDYSGSEIHLKDFVELDKLR